MLRADEPQGGVWERTREASRGAGVSSRRPLASAAGAQTSDQAGQVLRPAVSSGVVVIDSSSVAH